MNLHCFHCQRLTFSQLLLQFPPLKTVIHYTVQKIALKLQMDQSATAILPTSRRCRNKTTLVSVSTLLQSFIYQEVHQLLKSLYCLYIKKNVFQNHHKIFCKVSGSRAQTEKGNIHLLTGSETIELAHTSLNCRMFHGNKFYSFVN